MPVLLAIAPEIWAAAITGGATLSAAGVSAYFHRKAKTAEAKLERLGKQQQQAGEYLAGGGIYSYFKAAEISSEAVYSSTGDSATKRSWRALQITQEMILHCIPGSFWVDPPGEIKSDPVLEGIFPRPFEFDFRIDRQRTRCQYGIRISHGLSNTDDPIDFNVSIERSQAMQLSAKDARRAYAEDDIKNDYHCFDVFYPADRLEINVTLPDTITASLYPLVCLVRSEIEVKPELDRVEGGFSARGRMARFRVGQPLVGFRYGIQWVLSE